MKYNNVKLTILFAATFLLLLSGCAVTDFDRTANFSAYKTFAWGDAEIKVGNPVYESDLIHKNIRSTVESEFAKRGIVEDKNDPDFIVSYHTYTEQKTRSTGRSHYGYPFFPFRFHPFMYGWSWGFPYNGYGFTDSQSYSFTEGTLIIDVEDATTKELVWRGSVAGKVDNTSSLQKQIGKGIRAIMKKYPVSPAEIQLLPETPGTV